MAGKWVGLVRKMYGCTVTRPENDFTAKDAKKRLSEKRYLSADSADFRRLWPGRNQNDKTSNTNGTNKRNQTTGRMGNMGKETS
jgi:hypothetical protein